MRFPASVIEEIKSRFDIVQYVSRYVDLKRSGANLKGLCPFHQEKTPSFMVNPAKGIYKCFGCGEGGDVIAFLRGMENISFTESVILLAKESGVDIAMYDTPEAERERTEADLLYKINDEARSFFMQQLQESTAKEANDYLHKRGITPETIKEFSIGFAPATGNLCIAHMLNKGFPGDLIAASGLAIVRDDGSIIDKFRNRIMVPFQNLSALTCGFTGRVINSTDNPKYLNSPETAVFKKGSFLFGLLQAREAVKREAQIILVEGNFDLISLSQDGIVNAAATSGTALTDRQALMIKRFADKVVLVYDGDNAGQAATARGLPILMNAGLTVRIAVLPPGEDPDSFIRKNGREAFKNLITGASDIVDFTVNRFAAQKELSVPENKAELIKEMSELLLNVSNPVLRAEYIRRASEKTGVQERLIMGKAPQPNRYRAQGTGQGETKVAELSVPPHEIRLLELLIESCESCLLPVSRFVHSSDITHPAARTLLTAIIEGGEFHSSMLATLPPEAADLASRLAITSAHTEGSEAKKLAETHDIILKIKEKSIKKARTELMAKIKAASAEERSSLLKEFDAMTNEINSLKKLSEQPSESEITPL
ncbi:MAG: DNA primase [Fibrobacteres bacterium]|nr:DNA primase [Fibrobacterota bacterium]